MALKTNYKDDIFTGDYRKYRQINNSDGTISLSDVTQYSQTGDKFGASDINATNQAVNQLNSDLTAKVAGFTSGSYTKVTGLAYDSTNKKLGLKVNGADTVIPFRNGDPMEIYLPGQAPGKFKASKYIRFTLTQATSFFVICFKADKTTETYNHNYTTLNQEIYIDLTQYPDTAYFQFYSYGASNVTNFSFE